MVSVSESRRATGSSRCPLEGNPKKGCPSKSARWASEPSPRRASGLWKDLVIIERLRKDEMKIARERIRGNAQARSRRTMSTALAASGA